MHWIRSFSACTVVLAVTGCAMHAPAYQPSINNIELAKKSLPQPVKVAEFSVQTSTQGAASISLRGSSMSSPVGSSYAAYLAEALQRELDMARKLDPRSEFEVGGVLLSNDIDASGFSTAQGHIEARFTVKRNGQVTYDQIKRGHLQWESSFVGAVAIPKAVQSYPLVVQQLLGALYSDAAFQQALNK